MDERKLLTTFVRPGGVALSGCRRIWPAGTWARAMPHPQKRPDAFQLLAKEATAQAVILVALRTCATLCEARRFIASRQRPA